MSRSALRDSELLRSLGWGCVLAALLAGPAFAQQQLTDDEKAAAILATGRRAFNEGQLPVAIERFREFLKLYGGHKDANHARFGLGLALWETNPTDTAPILEALGGPAGQADFPERPLALFFLGSVHRARGDAALVQAVLKPNEAAQQRQSANGHFEQARAAFDSAAQGFQARAAQAPPAAQPVPAGQPAPAATGDLPADREWFVRSRCDQAEMLLKQGRYKEGLAVVDPLLADATLAKSRYLPLATYHAGYAQYMLGDPLAAARHLARLAPFQDPAFGLHARYLLARTHHQAGERAEALAHYEAIAKEFDVLKQGAVTALKTPANLKTAADRLRVETLANGPIPEYVSRSWLYSGVVAYELERFPEALDRFAKFATQFPNSAQLAEAELRRGMCQVRLRQWADAIKTLAPLQDHAALGDQARWWTARAHVGQADPKDAAAFAQNLATAADRLRTGADKAGQLAAQDPQAKLRRADMLLELADVLQSAGKPAEAAPVLATVQNEQPDADRMQQALQRQAVAFHLAKMWTESDAACTKFFQQFPQGVLGASVAFRFAENAFAKAEAAFADPNVQNKTETLKPQYEEAAKRYDAFLAKFPEFGQVHAAQHGRGLCDYRRGEYEAAAEHFRAVPDADRTGPLAIVNYLLADCIVRTAPTDSDDALAAGLMLESYGEAAKFLDAFAGSNADHPLVPEALLKLGECRQRIASVLAPGQERDQVLQAARQAYDAIGQKFKDHKLASVALFERANSYARVGDYGTAANEWNKFLNDPLKNAPIAPLAALRLASYHRSQNRAAEAVKILEQVRQAQEGNLLNDPQRKAWAPLLAYHHALAVKETGKIPEAQALFDALVPKYPGTNEAFEAAWRSGQCRRELIEAKLAAARAVLAKADSKPEEKTAATQVVADTPRLLGELTTYFEQQAAAVAPKAPGSEAHLRMFCEAAWCQRALAEFEFRAARAKLVEEARAKLQEAAAKQTPPGQPVPQVAAPDVAETAVPLQPSEQKARQLYEAAAAAAPESPTGRLAAFELGEVLALRGDHAGALTKFRELLDRDPVGEFGDKVRLRTGQSLLATGEPDKAAEQFDAVARNEKSRLAPEARFRQGEVHLLRQDWPAAIAALVPFRDKGELHHLPDLSDRALLRLGHAYAAAGQWEPSRQAFEIHVGRYPQSPFRFEAQYGFAWALQNLKQYDPAVERYLSVARSTPGEVAARAQLQIGLCRMAQQRYAEAANALLVVPFAYDSPESSALALCEAARALTELKQSQEAAVLLRRVLKEHPTGKWADLAKERLSKLAL